MKNKPKVGDQVYLVNSGVNVRGEPSPSKYLEVTKVGRKYFTIDLYGGTQFNIDDWCEKTEYTSNWSLYESESYYQECIEVRAWSNKFNSVFGGYVRADYELMQYKEAGNIFGINPFEDK